MAKSKAPISTAHLRKLINWLDAEWRREHCATEDDASYKANHAYAVLRNMAGELAVELLEYREEAGRGKE